MVERVARTLFERHWQMVPEGSRPAWPGDDADGADYWQMLAQAAIDAILSTGDDVGLVEHVRGMIDRRRKDAESLGGITEIDSAELDVAAAAILSLTARNKALEEALREVADGDRRLLRDLQDALGSGSLRPADAVEKVRFVVQILENSLSQQDEHGTK